MVVNVTGGSGPFAAWSGADSGTTSGAMAFVYFTSRRALSHC